jgi:hypothetical protein
VRFVLLAFAFTAAAFADCKTGRVVVDDGLAFTIPSGYCAEGGKVRSIETGAAVLSFGKSEAAPGEAVRMPDGSESHARCSNTGRNSHAGNGDDFRARAGDGSAHRQRP